MAQLTWKELKRNELAPFKLEPNVAKRSLYLSMKKSGDVGHLKSLIREVLEEAGLRNRMKKWTDDCLTRQNPEVFNKRSMADKLVRVGKAAIDMPTLKTEVAKKIVASRQVQPLRKPKKSKSTYSKPYPYV